uniref:Integrase catalytic domain-containing protein n=1 Tax=Acrobeloides nanus TaxID=290746 RepID=A0A914DFF2_9BILA
MAPLPAERVNRALPFSNLGIDYFGPIKIFDGCVEHKIWGSLFVCFVTRAVHLEAVTDLTSLAFIHAFRRFVARRTRPNVVWSDLSTTFTAASEAIKEVWNRVVKEASQSDYFSDRQIRWKFIPQLSPFFGGAYERLVAMVKQVLRHAIGKKRLSEEDFRTFLVEAECIVNTRPISYIHDDLESMIIIRPIDFWSPNAQPSIPPLLEDMQDDTDYLPKLETRDALIQAWRNSTRAIDKFWSYFYDQYLKALRERQSSSH